VRGNVEVITRLQITTMADKNINVLHFKCHVEIFHGSLKRRKQSQRKRPKFKWKGRRENIQCIKPGDMVEDVRSRYLIRQKVGYK
jgi:hypothetical protein